VNPKFCIDSIKLACKHFNSVQTRKKVHIMLRLMRIKPQTLR